MPDNAVQTPLIEMLARVPYDARVLYSESEFSSTLHPVGRLCHEARSEITRLSASIAELEQTSGEYCEQCGWRMRIPVRDSEEFACLLCDYRAALKEPAHE